MPNKNRNKNRSFNQNRNQNYSNGGHNGGGRQGIQNSGVHKRLGKPHGGGGGSNRRIYLNPTVIESLEDNYETEAPHSSNYHPRGDDRGKKNRAINRLKEMGTVKPKLSIGDTEQDVKKCLVESKPHCQLRIVPDDVFQLIVAYVQKYFTCFDSNRESLLDAYNSKCTFSFAINVNNPDLYRPFKFDELMFRESRNLKRIAGLHDDHHDKRFKLLHQGRIDTIAFLNKLPPTEHEPTSFKLDVCFFSPTMISFSLNGVYREGKPTDKVRPFRSFQRVFVCIPDPVTQMSIINEQFILCNLTREQYKKYYESSEARGDQAASSQVGEYPPQQPPSQPTTILQPILQNLTPEQVQIIQQFSIESRLNLEWSKYCLDHAQWNYEEAGKQFLQHKDKIPMEAFLA